MVLRSKLKRKEKSKEGGGKGMKKSKGRRSNKTKSLRNVVEEETKSSSNVVAEEEKQKPSLSSQSLLQMQRPGAVKPITYVNNLVSGEMDVMSSFQTFGEMAKNKYELMRDKRMKHKYEEENDRDCSFMLGRSNGEYDKREVLVSFPVMYKGVVIKMCFLQSEVIEMIEKGHQTHGVGRFSEEIFGEMRGKFRELGMSEDSVKIEMTKDFEDTVLEYGNPLINRQKGIENYTIQGIVLKYLIEYFKESEVDVNKGNFHYSNIYTQVKNMGKKVIRGALYTAQWVLSHPIMSTILFFLVKLIRVVICFVTSDVKKEFIKAMVDGAFAYLGDNPLLNGFKSLVTFVGECSVGLLSTNTIWAVLMCMKEGIVKLGLGNIGGIVSFILGQTSRAFVWMFEIVAGKYSEMGMNVMTWTSLVTNPMGVISSVFSGTWQAQKNKSAVLGSLKYHFDGDVNSIMIAVLLEILPYKMMENLVSFAIDMIPPAEGVTMYVKGLKGVHDKMMGIMNGFVSYMVGKKVRLSCLDLLIYMHKYTMYGDVIGSVVNELKSIVLDFMPCMLSRLWRYLKAFFGEVEREIESCCMKEVVNGVKDALRVANRTWYEWAWGISKDGRRVLVRKQRRIGYRGMRRSMCVSNGNGKKKKTGSGKKGMREDGKEATKVATLHKSHLPGKKYDVEIDNQHVSFGQAGASDFTKHHDEKRRQRYINRHNNGRENWNDYHTPGFWSRWLLWNKGSVAESIKDIERKFGLKINREDGIGKNYEYRRSKVYVKKGDEEEEEEREEENGKVLKSVRKEMKGGKLVYRGVDLKMLM
jgi:hypothetical protein